MYSISIDDGDSVIVYCCVAMVDENIRGLEAEDGDIGVGRWDIGSIISNNDCLCDLWFEFGDGSMVWSKRQKMSCVMYINFETCFCSIKEDIHNKNGPYNGILLCFE